MYCYCYNYNSELDAASSSSTADMKTIETQYKLQTEALTLSHHKTMEQLRQQLQDTRRDLNNMMKEMVL